MAAHHLQLPVQWEQTSKKHMLSAQIAAQQEFRKWPEKKDFELCGKTSLPFCEAVKRKRLVDIPKTKRKTTNRKNAKKKLHRDSNQTILIFNLTWLISCIFCMLCFTACGEKPTVTETSFSPGIRQVQSPQKFIQVKRFEMKSFESPFTGIFLDIHATSLVQVIVFNVIVWSIHLFLCPSLRTVGRHESAAPLQCTSVFHSKLWWCDCRSADAHLLNYQTKHSQETSKYICHPGSCGKIAGCPVYLPTELDQILVGKDVVVSFFFRSLMRSGMDKLEPCGFDPCKHTCPVKPRIRLKVTFLWNKKIPKFLLFLISRLQELTQN